MIVVAFREHNVICFQRSFGFKIQKNGGIYYENKIV